jgi:hypothetical protein
LLINSSSLTGLEKTRHLFAKGGLKSSVRTTSGCTGYRV